MTATISISQAAKDTVAALFGWAAQNPGKISRRGNTRRTVAYVPSAHPQYATLAQRMKPLADGERAAGILILEWLTPHSEALSVSGYYLSSSDEMAPTAKLLWVLAGVDGAPNLDYLTRDDGALAKTMRHIW